MAAQPTAGRVERFRAPRRRFIDGMNDHRHLVLDRIDVERLWTSIVVCSLRQRACQNCFGRLGLIIGAQGGRGWSEDVWLGNRVWDRGRDQVLRDKDHIARPICRHLQCTCRSIDGVATLPPRVSLSRDDPASWIRVLMREVREGEGECVEATASLRSALMPCSAATSSFLLELCASMHCSHDVTMRGSEAVSERCKVNREEKRSFEVTEWTLNRAKKRTVLERGADVVEAALLFQRSTLTILPPPHSKATHQLHTAMQLSKR